MMHIAPALQNLELRTWLPFVSPGKKPETKTYMAATSPQEELKNPNLSQIQVRFLCERRVDTQDLTRTHGTGALAFSAGVSDRAVWKACVRNVRIKGTSDTPIKHEPEMLFEQRVGEGLVLASHTLRMHLHTPYHRLYVAFVSGSI